MSKIDDRRGAEPTARPGSGDTAVGPASGAQGPEPAGPQRAEQTDPPRPEQTDPHHPKPANAQPKAEAAPPPAQVGPPTARPGATERLARALDPRKLRERKRHVRRATVDTIAPPPSPLKPIDLTDDTAVTEVLRLALWVGEVLMAAGTGAVDTVVQVRQVAAAYGLSECEVDVTYNSINISAHRGTTLPPAGSIRIVEHRSHDFTRLAEIDRLVRRIRVGAVSPKQAREALEQLTAAPHPYPGWVSDAAWAGMAGSIAVLLGAGPIVAVVAFLCTLLISRVNQVLGRFGLPSFFQQVVGGLIATIPAAGLYAARDSMGIDMRPSLVIASGIVVLLSGLSLVGSVQDAITGAPITASARFFEVLMMTAGIIVGVAIGMKIASLVGLDLPPISASHYAGDLTQIPIQVIAGAFSAGFFALACYAEARAVAVAGAAGAVGALVYWTINTYQGGPIVAAATAATVVGLAGGLLARRALTPPIIVGIAGITPLLPGLSVYRSLYSFLNNEPLLGASSLATVLGIGCSLAAGVVLGEWAARTLRRPRMPRRIAAVGRPVILRAAHQPPDGQEHTLPRWRPRRWFS